MWWNPAGDDPPKLKVWQILFLLLPFLLWWSYSSYVDFTRLENEGGILYVGRITKLLYSLGGKWAVVGFPLVVAAMWVYAVVVTLRLSKRAEQLANAADPDYVPPAPSPPPPAELPRAIATGAVPAARKLEPLAAAAPARPEETAAPAGDGPRLLR